MMESSPDKATTATKVKSCKYCLSPDCVTQRRVCKKCFSERHNAYMVGYYREHAAERKAYMQVWVKSENAKAWRRTDSAKRRKTDSLKAYMKNYAAKWAKTETGKKSAAAAASKYRKTPDGKAASKASLHKRRFKVKGSGVTASQIASLFAASRRCPYCECAYSKKQKASLDHVIPFKLGGTHSLDNLVVCCVPCNCQKNASSPEQWAARIGRLFI